jgi:hypothetical protein
MNIPDNLQSKKLLAFIIGVGAVLFVVILWIVADALWGINGIIGQTAVTSITGLTGIHIGGQSLVDRAQAYSPNYPSGGSYPPISTSPPITPPSIVTPPHP